MRADSWILNKLAELLVKDWYAGLIYTESDMQASAYFWLRRQFERDRSDRWYIRTEPVLRAPSGIRKPDIVVYRDATPFDFIELKCQLDGFHGEGLEADLAKLRDLKPVFTVRHAYQFVLYDDDGNWTFGKKESWMKNYVTFVSANVRRHPQSGRVRKGYDGARRHWEKWRESKPSPFATAGEE